MNIHFLQWEFLQIDVAYGKLREEHQDILTQDTNKSFLISLVFCVVFCKFHSKPLGILLEGKGKY